MQKNLWVLFILARYKCIETKRLIEEKAQMSSRGIIQKKNDLLKSVNIFSAAFIFCTKT